MRREYVRSISGRRIKRPKKAAKEGGT